MLDEWILTRRSKIFIDSIFWHAATWPGPAWHAMLQLDRCGFTLVNVSEVSLTMTAWKHSIDFLQPFKTLVKNETTNRLRGQMIGLFFAGPRCRILFISEHFLIRVDCVMSSSFHWHCAPALSLGVSQTSKSRYFLGTAHRGRTVRSSKTHNQSIRKLTRRLRLYSDIPQRSSSQQERKEQT